MSRFSIFTALRTILSICAALALVACSHVQMQPAAVGDAPLRSTDSFPPWMQSAHWQHQTFPTKRPTDYRAARILDRDALSATASRSMSVMRTSMRVEPQSLGTLNFSWLAHGAVATADVSQRDFDDAKLRIVLRFEGDRNTFSAKNRMLSELALTLTGEELPYATLMYVWCNTQPKGEIVTNPRTDRIRKIVVESGAKNLGRWLDFERDIRADFIQAFGEEPGALTGIALMTDTDNTQSKATAWYGPVSLKPLSAQPSK